MDACRATAVGLRPFGGESVVALDVAERLSYIEPLSPPLRALTQKILGTLVRLAFPRRR